jgi:lysophospholipase L1-like esterase
LVRALSGILLFLILAGLALLLLEGIGSAYGWALVNRTGKGHTTPHEMLDPHDVNNWILRPGYKISLSQYMELWRQNVVATAVVKEAVQKHSLNPNDTLYQINQFGFKGPEIEKDKKLGILRIMTIGDSCTFGHHYDWCSYSRALERYLQKQGYQVEVINAGVEGYATWNVLSRLDYFTSFQPDIAIIYLGWNDLYTDPLGIRRLWTYRAFNYFVGLSRRGTVVKEGKVYYPDHYYSSITSEAHDYELHYQPSFLPRVRQTVERLSERGIKPVLVTLPAAFSINNPPSEEVVQTCHLPVDIKNAYILAVMVDKYNNALRLLATEKGIPLIDLEEWSETTLVPPQAWYFDSLHLWSDGQIAIGEYIGQCLISRGSLK